MTNTEEQARQLMVEAEKKLGPRNFLDSIFKYYKNRTQDAIECYRRAGNLFKLSKNWFQSSSAFKLSAELNIGENCPSEAANDYVQASKCAEKFDTNTAIKYLLQAITIYTELGRFTMAARLHNSSAIIYEQNLQLAEAVEHYKKAADFYKLEENYGSAKKCLLKVAEYSSAEFSDYNTALHIYQEIAACDSSTPILKYNVKDSVFKAVLCHLCIDPLNSTHVLNSYLFKYPDFETSYQFNFLKKLIESIEESDINGFTQTVHNFNRISRLDTWHTKILIKIKKQIKETPDLL